MIITLNFNINRQFYVYFLDDGWDGAEFLDYFLMVRSALEAISGFHTITHELINFEASAFFKGEIKKMGVALKELDVSLLLLEGPAVAVIAFSLCQFPEWHLFVGTGGEGLLLFLYFNTIDVFLLAECWFLH